MKAFQFPRSISSILIVGLIPLGFSCYSHHTLTIDPEELPASVATVATTDGKFYQMPYWQLDNEGNITGIGVEFQSHSDWSRLSGGIPFDGTVASRRVARVEEHEVDLLIESNDGKYYRVTSWALDAEGNLVCRGSMYKSRDNAEDGVFAEDFQGTLVANDLKPIEIERFSFPKTVLLVAGILGGTFLVLFVIFISTYSP